ncbi:MAG: 50S ribosomal protein L11 methyltransferase [bacterium]
MQPFHDPDASQAQQLESRFGFRWVRHRIGAVRLRVAEIRDVDACVRALYPHCLVDHGDAPVWMISWPAAFGLAEFLVHEAGVAGRSVLELGCGTAVVGVAASLAGARVASTDYDVRALAVARRNGRENGCPALALGRLDWYRPSLAQRYELVVGSEITYHEAAFQPLLTTLKQAVTPGGTVVLSDIFRPQTDTFLDLASADGWTAETHARPVHLEHGSHAVRIVVLRAR